MGIGCSAGLQASTVRILSLTKGPFQCLLAGCSCTYGSKDGKFLFDDGIFCFRPKYAKRQLYRVSDSEVLALCWKLGLTDDASDGGPLAAGRCSA